MGTVISRSPKTIIEDFAGPSSYVTGGFGVTAEMQDLQTAKVLQTADGYSAEVASISGQTVTVKMYSSSGTEVTSGTGVTTAIVTLMETGGY